MSYKSIIYPEFPNFAVSDEHMRLSVFGNLLKLIASKKGKEKSNALRDFMKTAEINDKTLVMKCLQYAYDARRTYNFSKSTLRALSLNTEHDKSMWLMPSMAFALLDNLASRTVTGNAAAEALKVAMSMADEDTRIALMAILEKDLSCGLSDETVSDIVPGLYEVFRAHLAEPYNINKVSYPRIGQPKLDGFRMLVVVSVPDRIVRFRSREGNDFEAFEYLAQDVLNFVEANQIDCQLGLGGWGEMDEAGIFSSSKEGLSKGFVVLDCEAISRDFKSIASSARKKGVDAKDAKLVIFDILDGEEYHSAHRNVDFGDRYQVRRKCLELMFTSQSAIEAAGQRIMLMPQTVIESHEQAIWFFKEMRQRGIEGEMLKDPAGRYAKNRSYDWVKLKDECEKDLRVVGAYLGEKGDKYENMLGGLIVSNGTRRNKEKGVEETVLVRVGGGYTDDQRREFLELMNADLTNMSMPTLGRGDGQVDSYQIDISWSSNTGHILGRIARIEFHEETPDKSLRHPRFDIWRDTIKGGSKE